ncbi:MAG: DUF3570 domain-containing protein [Myxococcota bacterium]|nr:DUF3570 domain-containing protein [Myxococcota bacterium]MDW8362108.1 DUF3570 domain-containing protein [Myxococcales bacterium]
MRARITWILTLGCVLSSGNARADEAAGTWSGDVELRGNYYWERSTRVVAPEASMRLEAPNGTRLTARYLADAITSASIAAGTLVDVRFTELRHQITVGAGQGFDVGAERLEVDASTTFSTEPDYQSLSFSLTGALALDDRATVLRLGALYLHDEVGKVLRGADRTEPGGRDLSDRGNQGALDALVLSASWDQVVTRTLVATLGYDLGYNVGLQSNVYRTVSVDGTPQTERHPDVRWRHTAHGRVAWHLPSTGTTLWLGHRAYLDSWRIAALGPELRVYQALDDRFVIRARWRYYAQTPAFFWRAQYTGAPRYFSADPKMSGFRSHLLGLAAALRLDALADGPFDWLSAASVDVSFDHVWSTSRFGDGVIAQAGLRAPF